MTLSRHEFDVLRRYVHRVVGIELGDDKEYLVRQRLGPVLEAHGCSGFDEFCRLVAAQPSDTLRDDIIAAISTNETSFFRDERPFAALRERVLPWLDTVVGQRRALDPTSTAPVASILSAGASTGQEVWSVAMSVHEHARSSGVARLRPQDVRIVAADISRRVLAVAEAGRYRDKEVARGMPPALRDEYMVRRGDLWEVRESVRRMAQFRRLNLADANAYLGVYDVVFCRNVLIYFDLETKRRILQRIRDALTPGGFLILGATENLYGLVDGFESVHVANALLHRRVAAGG